MSSTEGAQEFVDILRAERRGILNVLRHTRFQTMKTGFSQGQVIPGASYSPWLDNETFKSLHDAVSGHTLVDVYRCYELFQLAGQTSSVSGDLVEVGVWRGGTAALLAGASKGKRIALFDTFSGVAKADARYDTIYKGGEHADTDRQTVEALFSRLDLNCDIHVGMFPDDTLWGLPQQIAMAHIDVDTYGSAKASFEAIWPRLSGGGVVVFDDYGFWGCEGVTQFVNDLVGNLNGSLFLHNLNGHGVIVKLGS